MRWICFSSVHDRPRRKDTLVGWLDCVEVDVFRWRQQVILRSGGEGDLSWWRKWDWLCVPLSFSVEGMTDDVSNVERCWSVGFSWRKAIIIVVVVIVMLCWREWCVCRWLGLIHYLLLLNWSNLSIDENLVVMMIPRIVKEVVLSLSYMVVIMYKRRRTSTNYLSRTRETKEKKSNGDEYWKGGRCLCQWP